MDKDPFFSIIMPTFNVEKYIEETINCIISQSFEDWELIIVDDCSSDKTLDLLKKYEKDGRIRISLRENNSGGCFIPRKEAADTAKGKFLLQLDADDLINASYLSELHQIILKEECDLVLTQMWRFRDDKNTAYKILPKSDVDTNRIWEGKELVKFTLLDWTISMNGYAVKREIFIKSGEYVKKSTLSCEKADELQGRYLLYFSNKVAFSSSKYLYRLNNESITSNRFNEMLRLSVVVPELIEFTRKFYDLNSTEYWLSKINFFFFVFTLYEAYDNPNLDKSEKVVLKKLINDFRKEINLKEFKGKVGLHYFYLMKMPDNIGRPLLHIIKILRKILKKT